MPGDKLRAGNGTSCDGTGYDALDRVVKKTYSDGTPSAAFTYDVSSIDGYTISNPVGRLVKAATGDGKTATWNSYDQMGRITNQAQCSPLNCGGTNYFNTFVYDFLGDHTSDTSSYTTGTLTISYGYNGATHPTSVTSNLVDSQHPATLASGITYDPAGDVSQLKYGNNLTETFVYNNRLQTCRININSSNTTLNSCTAALPTGNVQDFSYGFNTGSNNRDVASWSASGHQNSNRSYAYDSLNRLQSLSSPSDPTGCTGLSWTYDAWGNRTDQTVTGGTCNTFHASVNITNQFVGPPYQYDIAGNMTQDASHTYTYDAENRVTQVDGGSTASYVYDAFGRRARKTIGTSTTDYLYDLSGNKFAIFGPGCGGTGCWNAGAIYLNGRFFTEYYNGTTYFRTADHLGSARLLTDLSQSVFDSFDYLPFGEQIAGGNGTLLKFTGQERDSETSNDDFIARYNSSSLGRFMSADPENAGADAGDPQSWNAYAYVMNNPLNDVDPDGRAGCVDQNPFTCTVTADPPPDEQMTSFTWRVIWENVGRIAQKTNDYLHAAYKAVVNSRTACVATATVAGAYAAGYPLAETGAAGGAAVGAFGGPFDEVTIPAGSALGGLALGGYGAVKGGQVGYALGQAACSSGTGAGGSGSGGGSSRGGPANAPKPPADPTQPPGPGWQWRGTGQPGSSQGSWYNPSTGESLHPDLGHGGPIGPHWDYKDPAGSNWRIFPDGTITRK